MFFFFFFFFPITLLVYIAIINTLIKGDHLTREIILIPSKYVFSTSEILPIYIAVISDDIADIADSKTGSGLHCLLMPA